MNSFQIKTNFSVKFCTILVSFTSLVQTRKIVFPVGYGAGFRLTYFMVCSTFKNL